MNDVTQYFVGPDEHPMGQKTRWYVSRGAPACCLGMFRHADIALAQATVLAERRTAEGRQSQVHMQDYIDGPWRTVWHSAGTEPLYPHALPLPAAPTGVALFPGRTL